MLTLFIARVWRTSSNAAAVAAKGFRFVHAASSSFYLVRSNLPLNHYTTFLAELTSPPWMGQDCGTGSFLGNNPLGNSWCDPFKTWQNVRRIPFF